MRWIKIDEHVSITTWPAMVKRMVVYVSSHAGMFGYRFHQSCMDTPLFYPELDLITWLNTALYEVGERKGALSFPADGPCSYLKWGNPH